MHCFGARFGGGVEAGERVTKQIMKNVERFASELNLLKSKEVEVGLLFLGKTKVI